MYLKDVMRLLKKQHDQLDSLLADRKRQRQATTTFRGRCFDCGMVGHKRGSRDCVKAAPSTRLLIAKPVLL